MLTDFNFLPLYSKDKDNLYVDFYKICMENSIKYDRITGYFGSSIFVVISDALKTFIEKGGKIRIITSPMLHVDDIQAIIEGYKNIGEDLFKDSILREIDELSEKFDKSLDLLSKLISNNYLEIKIALFIGKNTSSYSQLVHDKIGIFTDENENKIAFGGSMNETFNGLSNYGNLESFSVFSSWENDRDKIRVESFKERFDEIWNSQSESVITFDFPTEAIDLIQSFSSEKEISELISEITVPLDYNFEDEMLDKWYAEKGKTRRKIRKHQKAALDNWESLRRRGIFEMATGSGKTFTALCAIRQSIEKGEIPLIIVPSNILLNQWRKEIEYIFEGENVSMLLCGDGNTRWKTEKLLNIFTDLSIRRKRVIISTIQTASSIDFINLLNHSEKIFLIVDEVHRAGSKTFRNIFNIKSGPRIGLSATPKRFRDTEGTKLIYRYFENEVYPKYTLYDAIKEGNLTPYRYEFAIVELTPKEQEEWNEITKAINKKAAILLSKNESIDSDESLDRLLIKRARIVKKAQGKTAAAISIIKKYFKVGDSWLVYCEDQEQLNVIFNELIKKGYQTYYYVSGMESDSEETLKVFRAIGGILVSIRCLDEGVDIPSVSHALILASSTNPREYIQRRGRVLRKSMNKSISNIYDCITVPNDNFIDDQYNGSSIIKSEIARAYNFSENAENKISNQYQLKKILIKYNIVLDIDKEGGYEDEQ